MNKTTISILALLGSLFVFLKGYFQGDNHMFYITYGSTVLIGIIVYMFHLIIKTLILLVSRIINCMYKYIIMHKERCLWILLLIFLCFLSYPICRDIVFRIINGSIQKHLYIFISGLFCFVWGFFIIREKISPLYRRYKKMITNNDISLFNDKNDKLDFVNFVLAAINIKEDSARKLRKFIILFCIPILLGGYIIGMMDKWQNIYNALSLASVGIAVFSVWYTFNFDISKIEISLTKEGDFEDIIAKVNNLNNDNEWHEEE